MKKKGKGLQIVGIIFLVLQVMSYTQLDINELFAPNNTTYDDFTYVFGRIAFFIGYSIIGLIGVGLLLAYKKKNSTPKQNKNYKETREDKEKSIKENEPLNGTIEEVKEENRFVCSNCGETISEGANKCPNCGESFEEENEDEYKKENNVKKTKSLNINQKYSDLNKLKELLDKEVITQEEFEEEKKKILKD